MPLSYWIQLPAGPRLNLLSGFQFMMGWPPENMAEKSSFNKHSLPLKAQMTYCDIL